MNIADVLNWRARKYAAKIALVEDERRRNFAEVAERAWSLVNALYALGLERGDRVAVLSDTCIEYAEITLAIPAGGMTLVPLNYRFIPAELAYTLNDCAVSALIVSAPFMPVLDAMRPLLTCCEHIVALGGEAVDAPAGQQCYEDLIRRGSRMPREVGIQETDIAYIIYTSGTTARPKGVMRSHKSIIATATATAYHHGLRHDDVCYLPNPPFHISYAWPLMAFFCFGCSTVIKRWEAEASMRIIEREKVSFGVFVPFFVRSMIEHPQRETFDLSSLRRLSMGSAPMDEHLARRALAIFGRIFNFNYGMTEYGSPIAMIHGDEIDLATSQGVELLASVGKAVFNADVRVVNSDGDDVPPGSAQTGEIAVRGDALMSGYWNMPEETARSMKDGYFYTGDVARVDARGNLYIVDRVKDMIITGGENVFCPEVESVLMSHPAVIEAAVIGVPDEQWGESVKALVIMRANHALSGDELRAFCRSRLAAYKIPKSIGFCAEFPRTSLGKISKKELREPYWAGRERNV